METARKEAEAQRIREAEAEARKQAKAARAAKRRARLAAEEDVKSKSAQASRESSQDYGGGEDNDRDYPPSSAAVVKRSHSGGDLRKRQQPLLLSHSTAAADASECTDHGAVSSRWGSEAESDAEQVVSVNAKRNASAISHDADVNGFTDNTYPLAKRVCFEPFQTDSDDSDRDADSWTEANSFAVRACIICLEILLNSPAGRPHSRAHVFAL